MDVLSRLVSLGVVLTGTNGPLSSPCRPAAGYPVQGGTCCAVSLWLRGLRVCTPLGPGRRKCHQQPQGTAHIGSRRRRWTSVRPSQGFHLLALGVVGRVQWSLILSLDLEAVPHLHEGLGLSYLMHTERSRLTPLRVSDLINSDSESLLKHFPLLHRGSPWTP